MRAQELLDILLGYGPLPKKLTDQDFVEQLKIYVEPFLKENTYTKRQLLLSAGHVADYIYFVEEGLARGFYIDTESEKERTHFLWGRHSIITVPKSFFHRVPSDSFIEVIPNTRLTSISHHHVMACIKAFPVLEIFSRNVILQYNSYESTRSHNMTSLTPWQRYLLLLKTHPDIEQQLSQENIASYVGIAPQSLSRMLKKWGHP